MKRNHWRPLAILIIALLLGSTMMLWGVEEDAIVLTITVALIIITGFAVYALKEWKNVKRGMPLKDERELLMSFKAGYLAFLASIWWLLLLSWAHSSELVGPFRDVSQGIGIGMLGMAIIFGAAQGYVRWKG